MEKQGKVKTLTFTKEWNPGNGQPILHVHAIEFENGDKGSIWCKTNMPAPYAPGATLGYEVTGTDKIKISRVVNTQPAPNNNSYPSRMTENRKSDIIGLAFAHAKDIVVAKINQQTEMLKTGVSTPTATAKKAATKPDNELFIYDPVSDICRTAEIIYNKMKELRQSETEEQEAPPVS